MIRTDKFIKGFTSSERKKIKTHLERLLLHLAPNESAIVGGLAIRFQLESRGIHYPNREFNDIDIIAKHESAIFPSIKKDFLIYHHHPNFILH